MKVLACNSNRPLAEAISAYLNIELTKASIRRFPDMEVFVEILENVKFKIANHDGIVEEIHAEKVKIVACDSKILEAK